MLHGEALFQAILDDPDDDTPRLVYADWLDEHGEADRAEFIRVQIELAKQPRAKRKEELQLREKELLDTHKDRWVEPVAEFKTIY